jgi:hypothetical protein
MKLRYKGKEFREHHAIGLRELGRGAGIRAARLVALEKGRSVVDIADLERMIAFFRQQGIACSMEDLVEEVEDPALHQEATR